MVYFRYQLMEDIYGPVQDYTDLTPQQQEAIDSITRPQLLDDMYRSGRERLPRRKPIFALREMD